jgi:23S rRNA (cytosine1962-C5)-methyltransferase
MKKLILKAGREKSVLLHHPWIFSGAVEEVNGSPSIGETVEVISHKGELLCQAAYSPQSQIRARIWSWERDAKIDQEFFKSKLARAINLRRAMIPENETNAMRLVHGESDGIPGLIVDRYADWLVVQFLAAGVEFWREEIVKALIEITDFHQVYERSDVDVRKLEGLPERSGALMGKANKEVVIRENSIKFRVDIVGGQKTGFYLDQRQNRQRFRQFCHKKRVLNCFSYTGGFSVYALAGGAREVISVDSSVGALEQGEANIQLNGLSLENHQSISGDVFQVLRDYRDRAQHFDLIVLDPPKFAPTISQAERAARAYKDINLLGLKLLNPGGLLFTFSCSGGISLELFQKIVAGAASDACIEASVLGTMTQGMDHPVALNFPEGAYLKGLICSV